MANDGAILIGKSGKPAVVQVVKISCDGGKTQFVAYYRKFTPEAQRQIASLRAMGNPARAQELEDWLKRGELVRRPEPRSPWVAATSLEGQRIRDLDRCGDERATVLFPDKLPE